MTMGLWGYQWRECIDPQTGEDEGEWCAIRWTRWEWWRVVLRVVVTPITLAADGSVGWLCAKVEDSVDRHLCAADSDNDDYGTPCTAIPSPPPARVPKRPAGSVLNGAKR